MRWLLLPVALCAILIGPIDRNLRALELVSLNATSARLAPITRLAPQAARYEKEIQVGGEPVRVSVFDPGGLANPPRVVLANGVVVDGRNYGELVLLAQSLARVGYLVEIPELYTYSHLRLDGRDVAVLQAAISDPRPAAAVIGISVGGSLGLIAAARVDAPVGVVAIGPYSRLDQVLAAATTGRIGYAGKTVGYRPASFVWTVLRDTLLADLRPDDRLLLSRLFPGRGPQPDPLQAHLVGQLGVEGRSVYALFTLRDHARLPETLARLPVRLRQQLTELSPATWAAAGTGRVVIFHFAGDPYFPAQESRLLTAQMGERARLFDSGLIDHGQLRLPSLDASNLVGYYLPETLSFMRFVSAALEASGR